MKDIIMRVFYWCAVFFTTLSCGLPKNNAQLIPDIAPQDGNSPEGGLPESQSQAPANSKQDLQTNADKKINIVEMVSKPVLPLSNAEAGLFFKELCASCHGKASGIAANDPSLATAAHQAWTFHAEALSADGSVISSDIKIPNVYFAVLKKYEKKENGTPFPMPKSNIADSDYERLKRFLVWMKIQFPAKIKSGLAKTTQSSDSIPGVEPGRFPEIIQGNKAIQYVLGSEIKAIADIQETEALLIFDRNCGICHANQYQTVSKIREDWPRIYGAITRPSNPMPANDSANWRIKSDGKYLIDYLKVKLNAQPNFDLLARLSAWIFELNKNTETNRASVSTLSELKKKAEDIQTALNASYPKLVLLRDLKNTGTLGTPAQIQARNDWNVQIAEYTAKVNVYNSIYTQAQQIADSLKAPAAFPIP